MAVDGDTVVVGAFGDDFGTNSAQGSAYVFVKPAGGWAGLLQENAKLFASDGENGDHSAHSRVAVSGDTVVVGRISTTSAVISTKALRMCSCNPPGAGLGLLTENAKLAASDGKSSDTLGDSVAVSGDTVVVYSAEKAGFGNNRGQGAGYVFVMPPGGWAGLLIENAKLVASDGAANDSVPWLTHWA